MSNPSFEIIREHELPVGIRCGSCGRTSYHPQDVAHRYCGACHVFHDTVLGADLPCAESAERLSSTERTLLAFLLQTELSEATTRALHRDSREARNGWSHRDHLQLCNALIRHLRAAEFSDRESCVLGDALACTLSGRRTQMPSVARQSASAYQLLADVIEHDGRMGAPWMREHIAEWLRQWQARRRKAETFEGDTGRFEVCEVTGCEAPVQHACTCCEADVCAAHVVEQAWGYLCLPCDEALSRPCEKGTCNPG